MSAGSRATTAYRIAFSAGAQEQWATLGSEERASLYATLKEVARTVGLRQWLSPEEGQEDLTLPVGGHVVTYHLEPGTRTLRVLGVSPSRKAPRKPRREPLK